MSSALWSAETLPSVTAISACESHQSGERALYGWWLRLFDLIQCGEPQSSSASRVVTAGRVSGFDLRSGPNTREEFCCIAPRTAGAPSRGNKGQWSDLCGKSYCGYGMTPGEIRACYRLYAAHRRSHEICTFPETTRVMNNAGDPDDLAVLLRLHTGLWAGA